MLPAAPDRFSGRAPVSMLRGPSRGKRIRFSSPQFQPGTRSGGGDTLAQTTAPHLCHPCERCVGLGARGGTAAQWRCSGLGRGASSPAGSPDRKENGARDGACTSNVLEVRVTATSTTAMRCWLRIDRLRLSDCSSSKVLARPGEDALAGWMHSAMHGAFTTSGPTPHHFMI